MSKVIKVGNSRGVYIPGNVLKEANLNVGDEIFFDVNKKGQIVMTKDLLGEELHDVESARRKLDGDQENAKQYSEAVLQSLRDGIQIDDDSVRRVRNLLEAAKKGNVLDAIAALTDKSLKDFL